MCVDKPKSFPHVGLCNHSDICDFDFFMIYAEVVGFSYSMMITAVFFMHLTFIFNTFYDAGHDFLLQLIIQYLSLTVFILCFKTILS